MNFRFTPARLSNGLRVLLKDDPSWPLVTIQAWVRAGSLDETARQAGVSHVLEHMVFKGTRRQSAAQISREIESLGGAMNAETTREHTHYYIDVPCDGARPAVRLMGDLLCRARLEPAEWSRECPVILEEMKRRNDDPDTVAWEALYETLFQDPAHQRSVIGTPDTVSGLTASSIAGFYRSHYAASRSLVVVAGDFKRGAMIDWLEHAFREMPRGMPPAPRPRPADAPTGRHVRLAKSVRQSYVAMGWLTPPAEDPDQEALDLLAAILGEGRNSRLVRRLREQKKLVWSIGASHMTHDDRSVFAISAECDPSKRPAFEEALMRLLADLRRSPPTSEEISRARHLMQTAWLQGFETFHSQASTVGAYALNDHLDRLRRYMDKLMRLSRPHLVEVIEKYLDRPYSSAVVEPS